MCPCTRFPLTLFTILCLMIRRPPRSTRTDTLFPTRRSSDLPSCDTMVIGFIEGYRAAQSEMSDGKPWLCLPKGIGGQAIIDAVIEDLRRDRKSTRLNSSH